MGDHRATATRAATAVAEVPPPDGAGPGWAVLVDSAATAPPVRSSPSVGRVVGRFVLANLVAVALLLAGSL